MTYTILAATFTNPEHSAAEIITQEAGPVLASAADMPEVWHAVLAASPMAYQAPKDPQPKTALEKMQAFLVANPDVAALISPSG